MTRTPPPPVAPEQRFRQAIAAARLVVADAHAAIDRMDDPHQAADAAGELVELLRELLPPAAVLRARRAAALSLSLGSPSDQEMGKLLKVTRARARLLVAAGLQGSTARKVPSARRKAPSPDPVKVGQDTPVGA